MILRGKSSKTAIVETLEEIKLRKQGLIQGIKTPWVKFNSMSGGFQQGFTYMIAAPSGVGKTTLLNIIESALFDVNKEKILLLCWNLEVSSTMTIVKKVSADLGLEVDKIMSFETSLSDTDFQKVQKAIQKYDNHSILYFEDPCNVGDIEETIDFYHNWTLKEKKEKGVDWKILVMLDHTLLVEKSKEKDNNELVANIGKMSIRSKKRTLATFIFLGQLNGNQEKLDRLQNPMFHAPIKDDLYGGKEIWHALETVAILVRPDLLQLESYTNQCLPTENRMYVHWIKNRFGKIGYTVFDTSKIGINKLIEL